MIKIQDKILGHKIKTVSYSEVNHHNGQFYFNGFDTFDYAINIQMSNDYWWHLGWKNQEYFELGEGLFKSNQYLNSEKVFIWEATKRWKNLIKSTIINFRVVYIDDALVIPWQIKIAFDNSKAITILIAEELNLNGSLPYPLTYQFDGEIYVFYNESLLEKNE